MDCHTFLRTVTGCKVLTKGETGPEDGPRGDEQSVMGCVLCGRTGLGPITGEPSSYYYDLYGCVSFFCFVILR